jgi:hypothetical protein
MIKQIRRKKEVIGFQIFAVLYTTWSKWIWYIRWNGFITKTERTITFFSTKIKSATMTFWRNGNIRICTIRAFRVLISVITYMWVSN